MSRDKSNGHFDWAALASDAADAAGFKRVLLPTVEPAFKLEGEVAPYLEVFFERVTKVDVAPEALLGIWIEEFELEWCERLERTSLPYLGERPVFHLLAANVQHLMARPWSPSSPSAADVAAVRNYVDRTFEYAKRLPSSVDSLVMAIRTDQIADHKVWFYCGHPVKVRAFVQWLGRRYGLDLSDRLLPGLEEETEPYDVQVMLDSL